MQPGIPKHGPAGPQWRAVSGHCRFSGCGMRLMAGTDASLTTDFKMRAQDIQANKAEIEEES
jgi:hypothetical protein